MTDILPATRMNRRHTYAPVGACIYCGDTEGPFSDEHIIPESFGGTLLLPKASCKKCADETGAFEGRCAGQLFRPARRILRLPQRNKKAKAKNGPETFTADIDGRAIKLAPQDFPGLLVSFVFDPPGLLLNLQPTEAFAGGVTIGQLPGFGERLNALRSKHGAHNEVSFRTPGSAEDVGRMLAKIGHAYAVAELGLQGFRPLLTNIIRKIPPLHIGHYVGGLYGDNQKGDDLHEIEISTFWPHPWVVVEVQLFADRSLPKHLVIAGERL